jgi:predicted ATPase
MIGLTGAQGTGKTTLAKRYSEIAKIPFAATSTRGVFARLGYDPKVDYPLGIRLDIQRHILDALKATYREAGHRFITDRTPIDLMAYTLADVQRANMTPKDEAVLAAYMRDCFAVLNSYFSTLLILQPGIPIVEEPGRAPMSFGYTAHISALIFGLTVCEKVEAVHYFIPSAITDLDRRVDCIVYSIKRAAEKFSSQIEQAVADGLHIH